MREESFHLREILKEYHHASFHDERITDEYGAPTHRRRYAFFGTKKAADSHVLSTNQQKSPDDSLAGGQYVYKDYVYRDPEGKLRKHGASTNYKVTAPSGEEIVGDGYTHQNGDV